MLLINYAVKLKLGVVISPTVLGGPLYGLSTVYSVTPTRDMGSVVVKATIFNGLMIHASCNVGLLESLLLSTRIALMWVTDMPVMP